MGIRTNPGAVQAILGLDYDTQVAPNLMTYITIASPLVDRLASPDPNTGITLTNAELERIEALLSAHYYCASDPQYMSKNTAGASGQFAGQTTNSIEATRYGQAAINLDITGRLNAISKRNSAGGSHMGRTPGGKGDGTVSGGHSRGLR